jgi:transketolase
MEIEPLAEKWKAFGWQVFECDGNNMAHLIQTFKEVEHVKVKPSVIIAKTLMGKGIKSIEDDYRWHGKVPLPDQVDDFLKQIEKG